MRIVRSQLFLQQFATVLSQKPNTGDDASLRFPDIPTAGRMPLS
jgi:hypothetical protein